ncbi:DNA internalization-related competence protein ComEC/Rec2, partial [bacterium]|nr:DNA internalization-related competence protein ComEC/Rec2 [bacterium]
LSSAAQGKPEKIVLPEGLVQLNGVIHGVPQAYDDKIRLELASVMLEGIGIDGRVILYIRSIEDVHAAGAYPMPGDYITAQARLRRPGVLRNSGVYIYDPAAMGIVATGYAKTIGLVKGETGLSERVHILRYRLGLLIERSFSGNTAALYKAIIPGLKRGMPKDMKDDFSATGLAHLLSISGTHFGLLAFLIFSAVRMITNRLPPALLRIMTLYLTPSQVAVITTLPVLFIYVLVAGAGTATIRSFIMIFIYMCAVFSDRKDQWLNSLSIAAVIILLYEPDQLFSLSFLLSFAAVLFIGMAIEKMGEERTETGAVFQVAGSDASLTISEKTALKLKTGLFISLAALAGTAPVVVMVFKQFPLISPLTNLLITPIVCFVILPAGFFSAFVALVLNLQEMPLNSVLEIITQAVLKIISLTARIPYSQLHPASPSAIMIMLYYLSFMLFIAPPLRLKEWMNLKKLPRSLLIIPFALVFVVYIFNSHYSGDELRVTFLDIGQGDSAVVELPDGRVALIDGGSKKPDMGRMVVAPWLWSRGIRKIDYLVVSHLHPDHSGGLPYIVNNFEIGEIWMTPQAGEGAESFAEQLRNSEWNLKLLSRGDVLVGGDYKFEVLHPYPGFSAFSPRGRFSNENSDSLVIRLESRGLSFVFTGDIEIEAERDLIYLGKWLDSDIIKVPHHGSRTSSSEGFLDNVSPKIAIISSGRNNSFKHPHKETLQRYQDRGIAVYNTAVDGAVSVSEVNGGFIVSVYMDHEFIEVGNIADEVRNLRLLF